MARAHKAKSTAVTWEAYLSLDEDDTRELIDGELVEVEVPTALHEWIVQMIGAVLWNWARSHGGVVLGSGYKVRITARSAVMPDVQFFRKGHEAIIAEQGLAEGAPDLAVEVVSPSSRSHDRVRKLAWYARIRVPEYWIVDPEAKTLERLVLDGPTYRIADSVAGDAIFRPASFAGLEIRLTELFKLPGAKAR